MYRKYICIKLKMVNEQNTNYRYKVLNEYNSIVKINIAEHFKGENINEYYFCKLSKN